MDFEDFEKLVDFEEFEEFEEILWSNTAFSRILFTLGAVFRF